MRRGLAGIIVLLLLLCATPSLYGADESESTRLMETTGSPYEEPASAPPPTPEFMIMDLIFVRPLGFLSLAVGTGIGIAATPFAVASGSTGTVYKKLVVEPFNFTVRRPLGKF